MWIGEDMLYDAIAPLRIRIREPVEQAIALRIFNAVIKVTLFLVAKGFAVADEELKISRIWMIDVRIVNLIDDTVAEREPKAATSVVSRAHAFLGAGGPARFDSWRSKSH